jgi:hypothetical protein
MLPQRACWPSLVTVVACSSPSPTHQLPETVPLAAPSAVTSSASAKAPDPGPEVWSVAAPKMPASLTIDGDLREWPTREPGQLFVAVEATRLVVAAAWTTAPPGGVVIALGEPVSPYPEIGWQQRGGSTHELTDAACERQQVPMIEAGWMDGEPHPPEVVAACRAILARHRERASGYTNRFLRRFRITADAVRTEGAGADPSWTVGARFASGPLGVEVELPLAALPELRHAPLTRLLVAAAAGDLVPSPEPPVIRYNDGKPPVFPGWYAVSLAEPVGFGPRASLLAKVFPAESEGAFGYLANSLSSYHPADAERVRTVSVDEVAGEPIGPAPSRLGVIGPPTKMDRPSTTERLEPLFQPYRVFGNVEIGLANGQQLVTYVAGQLMGFQPFGKPLASREVSGDLHLFDYDPPDFNPYVGGWMQPTWRAVGIKPDGTIVPDLAAPSPDDGGWNAGWDVDPKSFADRDYVRFGVRGTRKGKPRSIVWRWDAKTGRYESSASSPLTLP